MARTSIIAELMAVQSSPHMGGHMATSITMQGRSGATYQFEVHAWGTSFNSVGAVYSVLKARADGRFDVIYIGQTDDLGRRLSSHERQLCFDRNGKTHVGAHVESSETRRLSIERDLIDFYDPPCNRQ